jgi:hypothetical protein
MVVDNPNILVLARKLETVPHVVQVRFHAPLKTTGKELVGPGGMFFSLMVQCRQRGPENHVLFGSLIPARVIDDETTHQSVIDESVARVSQYVETGIFEPAPMWRFNNQIGKEREAEQLAAMGQLPGPAPDEPTQNTEESSQNP